MASQPSKTGKKSDVPPGLWTQCASCKATVYEKEVKENLHVCPSCGFHRRIDARTRIEQLVDPDTFEEFAADLVSTDPLRFVWETDKGRTTYRDRMKQVRKDSDTQEAIVVGKAFIRGRSVVLGVMDPR